MIMKEIQHHIVHERCCIMYQTHGAPNDLPQMGQYLLTLPQHLEPLLVSPSPALNRALQQLTVEDLSPG